MVELKTTLLHTVTISVPGPKQSRSLSAQETCDRHNICWNNDLWIGDGWGQQPPL